MPLSARVRWLLAGGSLVLALTGCAGLGTLPESFQYDDPFDAGLMLDPSGNPTFFLVDCPGSSLAEFTVANEQGVLWRLSVAPSRQGPPLGANIFSIQYGVPPPGLVTLDGPAQFPLEGTISLQWRAADSPELQTVQVPLTGLQQGVVNLSGGANASLDEYLATRCT